MPRLLLAVALAGAAAVSLAQTADETNRRGSIPPGESRDDSAPAAGAIKGGSIELASGGSRAPERDKARCEELTGVLREQCLRELGGSAGDAARPAGATPLQADRAAGFPRQQSGE